MFESDLSCPPSQQKVFGEQFVVHPLYPIVFRCFEIHPENHKLILNHLKKLQDIVYEHNNINHIILDADKMYHEIYT